MSGEQSIGQNESPQTQPFPRREDICFPEKPLRVGAGGGGGSIFFKYIRVKETVENLQLKRNQREMTINCKA